MSTSRIRVGLIGAGRIGRNHAEILALHTPGATLSTIADPSPGAARALGDDLGVDTCVESVDDLLASPLDAVVICAPSVLHSSLISKAAAAGLAVFCEKPAGMSLAEIDSATKAAKDAGVPLQIGFNRRFATGFAAARRAIDSGRLGTVQLLRSNTRDPGLANPAGVPAWTIFTQTLIHDFDTLNWLNPGARPVRVFAQADALVAPEFAESGLLDTALVTIAYSNGALAMADASFQAVYGYDVRAEVFGSGGLAQMGHTNTSDLALLGAHGIAIETSRSDTDLMQDSYRAELVSFVEAARTGVVTAATGADARAAFEVAQAAITSMQTGEPVQL